MHCPGCGQQQISNETKFCSRCGLPLSIVSEVLVHGGYLPQLAAINNKQTIFTRRNGVSFSILWCLFFLLIMAPLWGILKVEELAAASAVIGIFGGFMWLITSLMFFKKVPDLNIQSALPPQPAGLYGRPEYNALPQPQSIPASAYGPPQAGNWRDTNDLQPVRSESATKLLNENE